MGMNPISVEIPIVRIYVVMTFLKSEMNPIRVEATMIHDLTIHLKLLASQGSLYPRDFIVFEI